MSGQSWSYVFKLLKHEEQVLGLPQLMFFADCCLQVTELSLKNGELQSWSMKSKTPARIISRFYSRSLLNHRMETSMQEKEGQIIGRWET